MTLYFESSKIKIGIKTSIWNRLFPRHFQKSTVLTLGARFQNVIGIEKTLFIYLVQLDSLFRKFDHRISTECKYIKCKRKEIKTFELKNGNTDLPIGSLGNSRTCPRSGKAPGNIGGSRWRVFLRCQTTIAPHHTIINTTTNIATILRYSYLKIQHVYL